MHKVYLFFYADSNADIEGTTVSGHQQPVVVNKMAKFTISTISNNLDITVKGGGRVCCSVLH